MKVLPIQYIKKRKKEIENIPALNMLNANFRNPNKTDPFGYIEIESQGIIKQIQIRFTGDITIHSNGVNEYFKYIINYNTKFIVLSNMHKADIGSAILIKYTGFISSIPKFRAFGFNNSRKFLTIKPPKITIDYIEADWDVDETAFPNDYDFPVDFDYVAKGPPKMATPLQKRSITKKAMFYKDTKSLPYNRIRTKSVLTNYSTPLPKSYKKSKYENNLCLNCLYFKKNICKLWNAKVRPGFLCDSWDNNRGVKKEFVVGKTFIQEN